MLNNRQNGRRRGRGRGPNTGGQRGNESRIDNRARGNAPQLLEKYKNMARDAQLSGDRVMTEYYLQFADHYFRIVSETRVRFEEQRRQRDDWRDEGEEGYESDDLPRGSEESNFDEESADQQGEAPRSEPRESRRREREPRRDREPRARQPRDDHQRRNEEEPAAPVGVADGVSHEPISSAIDVAVLPPALGVTADPIPDLDDEPAPTPRRRGRPRKIVAEDAPAEG